MLEWERDHNGNSIPKWNGNLLASKMNPEKEAQAWLERQSEKLDGQDTIFVLGLGAGFHVSALRARYNHSRIVVIETIKPIAEATLITDVLIWTPDSPADIFAQPEIPEIFSKRFAILRHGPSCRASPVQYSEIEGFLTGRDPRSLAFHLQFRPADAKFFERIALPILKKRGLVSVGSATPLSIRNILTSLVTSGDFSDEARIWLALGELIK
jgi:hypothetical protein